MRMWVLSAVWFLLELIVWGELNQYIEKRTKKHRLAVDKIRLPLYVAAIVLLCEI